MIKINKIEKFRYQNEDGEKMASLYYFASIEGLDFLLIEVHNYDAHWRTRELYQKEIGRLSEEFLNDWFGTFNCNILADKIFRRAGGRDSYPKAINIASPNINEIDQYIMY